MLAQRFPYSSAEQIMPIAGIPLEEIHHTRAVEDWLAEGSQEGLQEGLQEGKAQEATKATLRLLNRRCGPLSKTTTAQIQALPVEQLEALAVGEAFSAGVALLDLQGPAELAAWLAGNT
jgi:predicted transposase YdaD